MTESLSLLMRGIVDYAGLFPPAKLPLKRAAAEYLDHMTSPQARMLSHFICPVGQFGALEQELAGVRAVTVSALGAGGDDTESWNRQLTEDLAACAALEESSGGRVRVEAFEAPLPHSVRVAPDNAPVRDWIQELHRLVAESGTSIHRVFLETPPGTKDGEKIHWLFSTLELAELPDRPVVGVKLRTGGLEPAAFPTTKQVAAFMNAAWKNDLIFKCTAGLHHPFRHFNKGVGCEMHGFLNVFCGAALLASGNLPAEKLQEVLEDQDPGSFAFDNAGLSWKGHTCPVETIKAARTAYAISFGSCSFQEPLDDLLSHQLI